MSSSFVFPATPKLITGARIFALNHTPNAESSSTRLIRVQQANDLGLRVLGSHTSSKSRSAYISVTATDNPLLFHDDFCAEHNIPIVVGGDALTGRELRRHTEQLCRQHSLGMHPQRWVKVLDAYLLGLLDRLKVPVLARESLARVCEFIASTGDASGLPDVLSAVPHLQAPDLSLAQHDKFLLHVGMFDISDALGSCSAGVDIFHESLWPCAVVRHVLSSSAVVRQSTVAGHRAVVQNLSLTQPWMSRDHAMTAEVDVSIKSSPLSPVLSLRASEPALLSLEECTDPQQKEFIVSYIPQTVDGSRIPVPLRLQLIKTALRHRDAATEHWTYVQPRALLALPMGYEVTSGVPVVTYKGYRWVNIRRVDKRYRHL